MALKESIQNDMKAALLGGDRFEGDVLRNLKAAILDEEVAKGKREDGLDDSEIEKIIAREVKKRKESAKIYRENGRADLAEPEEQEIEVLQRYLPEQTSEDDIRNEVRSIVATQGISGPQAMGQVIGAVKAKFGTAADGALVAKIVKEELTK